MVLSCSGCTADCDIMATLRHSLKTGCAEVPPRQEPLVVKSLLEDESMTVATDPRTVATRGAKSIAAGSLVGAGVPASDSGLTEPQLFSNPSILNMNSGLSVPRVSTGLASLGKIVASMGKLHEDHRSESGAKTQDVETDKSGNGEYSSVVKDVPEVPAVASTVWNEDDAGSIEVMSVAASVQEKTEMASVKSEPQAEKVAVQDQLPLEKAAEREELPVAETETAGEQGPSQDRKEEKEEEREPPVEEDRDAAVMTKVVSSQEEASVREEMTSVKPVESYKSVGSYGLSIKNSVSTDAETFVTSRLAELKEYRNMVQTGLWFAQSAASEDEATVEENQAAKEVSIDDEATRVVSTVYSEVE